MKGDMRIGNGRNFPIAVFCATVYALYIVWSPSNHQQADRARRLCRFLNTDFRGQAKLYPMMISFSIRVIGQRSKKQ